MNLRRYFSQFGLIFILALSSISGSALNARTNITVDIMNLMDVVLKHHVDSPTRQEMVLHATQELFAAAKFEKSLDLSVKVSALASLNEIRSFLVQVIRDSSLTNEARVKSIMMNGLLECVPGHTRLIQNPITNTWSDYTANTGTHWLWLIQNREPFFIGDMICWKDVKVPPFLAAPSKWNSHNTLGFGFSRLNSQSTLMGVWNDNHRLAGTVGYARLASIGPSTLHDLRRTYQRMNNQNLKGLILDFRWLVNQGQAYQSSILVADAFIGGGVLGKKRTRFNSRTLMASKDSIFVGWPLSILLSSNTGNDGLFVASVLKDHRKALVVGADVESRFMFNSTVKLPGNELSLNLPTVLLESPRLAIPSYSYSRLGRRPHRRLPDKNLPSEFAGDMLKIDDDPWLTAAYKEMLTTLQYQQTKFRER